MPPKVKITKDRQREDYLKSLSLQILRYTNDEVIKNLDGVLEDLTRRLFQDSTSPTAPPYKGGESSGPFQSSDTKFF